MAKTPDQQKLLDTIWHDLHEKKRLSGQAASLAHKHRLQEDTNSEMALELAHMEFVTAVAAARDSKSYREAHPHLMQAAQVVIETFPLDSDPKRAQEKGNAWDTLYGDQKAQIAILRNYFHLIRRLEQVIPTAQFHAYSHSLWHILLQLSQEFEDDVSIKIFRIENDVYVQAKQAFENFLIALDKKEGAVYADSSKVITVASRMMNRALQEGDYDMVLKAFTTALNAVRKDPNELLHFTRQIAVNVRADKKIRETNKFLSWQTDAAKEDLTTIQELVKLTFVGLGNDRVESLDGSM